MLLLDGKNGIAVVTAEAVVNGIAKSASFRDSGEVVLKGSKFKSPDKNGDNSKL